ncbi:MAG: leucine-rich repeat domain-containing protein [Oscillospiraceae bacterium]|nr:leucine-rich repeat domain-containing protein [Oscillospiraceae bacterium]
MDIQKNNAHSGQEITVKPPVFTREMAKKVLAERRDGVLAIPDEFEVLADDFAYLMEQTAPDYDANYLFSEIHLPASVSTVGSLYFAYQPESVLGSGFQKIVVAKENLTFCSADGVLFTKDMKKLICYPCGKQETDYTVPAGVEVIGTLAFWGNGFLKRVCLPPSVKVIECAAFSSCSALEQVSLSEGLEVIEKSAFHYCNIPHLKLPRSLRKIHWTNLSDGFGDIGNLEIPDARIEIDEAGFRAHWEKSFVPPLFLLNKKNRAFQSYASKHNRNVIRDFSVDEEGIVWTDDGATLVEFPLHWKDEEYRVPDKVTGVFRWAFNGCDVKRVVASRELNLIGETAGQDHSRLDPKDDQLYDPNFLVAANDNKAQPSDHQLLTLIYQMVHDTNNMVMVRFAESDLQNWLANQRPGVDDDERIEQFAQKTTKYINRNIQASDRDVEDETAHLQSIFGGTWDRLLPATQSSLISAGVLWNLCAKISTERFDYSGIVIASTSALESELKRWFYTDFQRHMVEHYGDPAQQNANKIYRIWPETLLSCTKKKYNQGKSNGSAPQLSLGDHFMMGTLPYLFSDRNAKQNDILKKRMGKYLRTVVREEYREAPVKAFADQDNVNSFVRQCENIRMSYRNPAGHTGVLDKDSAAKCYEKIVGNEKVEGLIMTLYSYLR